MPPQDKSNCCFEKISPTIKSTNITYLAALLNVRIVSTYSYCQIAEVQAHRKNWEVALAKDDLFNGRTSSFGLVVHLENAILARIIKDQSFHMPITSLESLICTSEPASWFLVLPSPPFYQFSTSKTIQKSRYFRTLRPPSKQLLMDWAYFN